MELGLAYIIKGSQVKNKLCHVLQERHLCVNTHTHTHIKIPRVTSQSDHKGNINGKLIQGDSKQRGNFLQLNTLQLSNPVSLVLHCCMYLSVISLQVT